MVFDAHDRGFAFFKGACERGIYDNMKTAVETIFVGKERQYNRRFLQMCGHYLVEPVACTPASGWEKGQVENQVGLVRERFFTPRLRFKSYDELNAWLLDKCVAYAKAHRHPEIADKTIWEVFEEERPKLVPLRGRFDGFHAVSACGVEDLPRSLRQQQILGQGERRRAARRTPRLRRSHRHPAGRDCRRRTSRAASVARRRPTIPGITCRFWRESPARLRNGAPFKDWVLPSAMEKIRRKLAGSADGDRQMVKILAAVLDDGLAGGRSRLRRGAGSGRPFRRRHSQHPRAAPRSRPAADHPHAGRPEAAGMSRSPIAQDTIN